MLASQFKIPFWQNFLKPPEKKNIKTGATKFCNNMGLEIALILKFRFIFLKSLQFI